MRRRNPLLVWSRRLLALGVLVAGAFYGYRALRAAGFQFRWERGSAGAPASQPPSVRLPRPVQAVGPTGQAGRASAEPGEDGSEPATAAEAAVTSVLEPPPSGGELPPAGGGRAAAIGFESFPSRAFCAPCPVSDEWASLGVILSFRSWTADSTEPFVLDGQDYLPPDASRYALGPTLDGESGLEVGVIRLDFSERPRLVTFSVFGPDLVRRFDITAWSGDRILDAAVERAAGGTYDPAGRGLFREESITVRSELGIDRISLDGWGPPGHILLIDDLVITP